MLAFGLRLVDLRASCVVWIAAPFERGCNVGDGLRIAVVGHQHAGARQLRLLRRQLTDHLAKLRSKALIKLAEKLRHLRATATEEVTERRTLRFGEVLRRDAVAGRYHLRLLRARLNLLGERRRSGIKLFELYPRRLSAMCPGQGIAIKHLPLAGHDLL